MNVLAWGASDAMAAFGQPQQQAAPDTPLPVAPPARSLKLFPDECPRSVENFTTHAKNGYYDNVIFHRVIKGFMIQTGDPHGGQPGLTAAAMLAPHMLDVEQAEEAMARTLLRRLRRLHTAQC